MFQLDVAGPVKIFPKKQILYYKVQKTDNSYTLCGTFLPYLCLVK